MIKESKIYRVKCDNCGKIYADDDDHEYWSSPVSAEETAIELGKWIEHDGSHYCADCHSIGENYQLIIKYKGDVQ